MIELWGESEAEVGEFLRIIDFDFDSIFIAKRGIGRNYLEGRYFVYDQALAASTNKEIKCPKRLQDLVQWCSSDIYITKDGKPVIAIEITYHKLTYNNIAQRIPRQVRAAMLGVTNVIFQKVNDLKPNNLLCWYTKTFEKATKIFGNCCLAIIFDENNYSIQVKKLRDLCFFAVNDNERFNSLSNEILEEMGMYSRLFTESSLLKNKRGAQRKWLKVENKKTFVFIGVRRNCGDICGVKKCRTDHERNLQKRKIVKEKTLGLRKRGCVWLTKGTGGMDPYPGLVKMVEILFCFDDKGSKIRKLVTVFKNLPQDFWWFEKYPDEIYYKILKEISDEIIYYNSPLKRKTSHPKKLEEFH